MSLANAYLNPSYQNAVPTQRIGGVRYPRSFATSQSYQQSQNFDISNWMDRNKIMNQLSVSPVAMDPKLNDPFMSGRFASSRTVDEPKSPVINQRLPLASEGLGFNEMPVSRPSKLQLSGSCDVGGAYNPMVPTVPPPPPHSEDSSRWVMYPPVPAYGSEHLKTGRFHLMRNTSPDKFPQQLGPYTSVSPMENTPLPSRSLGLPTQCFRAWCPRLCSHVVLRRVILEPSKTISKDACFLANELGGAKDSSVLRLLDVVPVQDFRDNSVLFTYEFLPCARTLGAIFMMEQTKSSERVIYTDMLQERTAWLLLVQLTQSIRFAHKTLHRSVDVLDPSKILIQDGTRLFVNCFGLKDVVNHPSLNSQTTESKVKDFIALGKLMLGAIVGTGLAFEKPTEYLPLLDRAVSQELRNLIRDLLSGSVNTVDALVLATADHVYDNLDAADTLARRLELHALNEVSNGRLFRLVCKLNSVIERQDTRASKHHEPEWSETDDRYMLKLFRDYVFHQVDHNGAPYLDLAHIVSALNKVEAGSGENVCLVSRKGEKAIIVTYAEIRDWLDKSFSHLVEDCRRSVFEQQMAQDLQREHQQQKRLRDDATSEVSLKLGSVHEAFTHLAVTVLMSS
ncbi:PAB-dependent poly(A)-specific ribonuclease subunit [Echinococcus granulosus]|uniref:PAB-dependent poly(A)-specific ribonuclease subunit n=1 Tax=Echinococcus granulosus TaxID=6210 RepID=W6UE02_ECHGR|nr:PAB-dependent poly(A)-specific ribonuclease subunit [Echinococcus granulosus]EUB59273.1 PAB-dependent poly(A)-specific ribonuclease subunit [Echinococcus granulosus]